MNKNEQGYVRVGNMRGETDFRPKEGEVVVVMDRTNPLFGNPYPMKVRGVAERDRVIALYKTELDEDIQEHGPRWQFMQEMAKNIVEKGTRYICMCHCAPVDCHVDLIVREVNKMVEELVCERDYAGSKKQCKL